MLIRSSRIEAYSEAWMIAKKHAEHVSLQCKFPTSARAVRLKKWAEAGAPSSEANSEEFPTMFTRELFVGVGCERGQPIRLHFVSRACSHSVTESKLSARKTDLTVGDSNPHRTVDSTITWQWMLILIYHYR
jgi:hypothetical protein